MVSCIDITRHNKKEVIAQDSEEKLRLFVEGKSDGFFIWDSKLNLVGINGAGRKMLLVVSKEKDVIGKNVLELVPSLKEKGRYKKFMQLIEAGVPFEINDVVSGFIASRTRRIVIKTFKLQSGLGMVVSDATKLKKIEHKLTIVSEELQKLYQHIVFRRKEEREYLAHQVHDELGQMLAVLKMDLSYVNKNVSRNEWQLCERLESMMDLLDTTIEVMRNISMELRPQALGHVDLIEAIEWQSQEFENVSGINCEVSHIPMDIAMDYSKIGLVLKIFREALSNVFYHANATKVEVKILLKGEKLIIKIIDNGRGISKAKIKDPRSIGIIGMRKYALAGRGALKITGEINKGTIVVLEMPFR